MELIYQNFDGLDVTFQGVVPDSILKQLEKGRQEAEDNSARRSPAPALVMLGKGGIPVHVAESGMKGGFRYRLDTGPDGEVWFLANSDDPKGWNIRVSVKSLSLALYGYAGVKARIYAMLENLEAKGSGEFNNKTGEIYDFPKEAISRVDYCFDFISEDFKINQEYLIAHSRCKKKDLLVQEIISAGRNIIYSRIGSMPNRQIVLYDKIREIQEKHKSYWWKIWGIEKEEFNKKIWRIEVRAGKKELKNWNLRTFDDFENKIGDVILSILKVIKYVRPNLKDTNPNRWPLAPFWAGAQNAAGNALAEYISNAKRNPIIEDYREELENRYKNQIAGMIPAYAVIKGKDYAAHIPGVLEEFSTEFSEDSQDKREKIQNKMEKAKNKFVFLNKNDE